MTQVLELKSGDATISAQGINLSESGILCRADQSLPVGAGVFFKLIIPSGKSEMVVDCEGVILRCTEDNGKFDIIIDLTSQDCM